MTLDALVGRLTAFELDNFDNYLPTSKNIESVFEVNCHSRKRIKSQNLVNQKVMKMKH